jgi:holliday junction DNA helicase RuvA
MIARLRGTLIERGAQAVVVDCGGVGYEVHVSLATIAQLPEPGDEVVLRVFTQAQENKIALYGFATAEERELFDRLITVKNVGPATAMELLSAAPSPIDLARLIAKGDARGLTKLRGVGQKRADLLVVELREKCETLLMTWGAGPASPNPVIVVTSRGVARDPVLDDVVSALVHMGCRPSEAEKVVQKIEVPPGATVETLLVEALRAMPRSLG